MDICPKNTLNIIAKLEMLGFSNSHFQLIHHWGSVSGKDSSLDSHKNYLSRSKGEYRVGANNFEVAVYLENCLEKAEETGNKPDFFKICRSLKSGEDLGMKSPEGSLENDSAKLDDELLQQFMKGFYGYGNYKSNLWFVGMEEGGGNSAAEIQKRLDIWNKHGQVELEDVVDFHNEIGVGEYFTQTPKLQRTWGQLIRIILESEGENSNPDQCKKYQISGFARKDSNHCLLELFPLPSPSSTHWSYAQFSNLKYLKDRETYKRHCLDFRIKHLKERIKVYQPKAVIFYGSSYREYWAQVAECNFKQHSGGHFYYAEDSNTRFFVIQHPAAQGVSNHYFSNIGQLLLDKSCS